MGKGLRSPDLFPHLFMAMQSLYKDDRMEASSTVTDRAMLRVAVISSRSSTRQKWEVKLGSHL